MTCVPGRRSCRATQWLGIAVTVAATAACASTPPPPEGGVRELQGNILSSTAMPTASLIVDPALAYAGSQTITLGDVARAEQHFFAELGSMGTVSRLLWVQYEGFLETVDHTYDYSDLPTVAAGDLVVHHDAAFYPTTDLDTPRDSDGARAKGFLQTVGYRLGADVLRWRFVWVSASGRNELMIIYMEDLAELGLTRSDLEDPSRWQQVSEQARDRALDSFELQVR